MIEEETPEMNGEGEEIDIDKFNEIALDSEEEQVEVRRSVPFGLKCFVVALVGLLVLLAVTLSVTLSGSKNAEPAPEEAGVQSKARLDAARVIQRYALSILYESTFPWTKADGWDTMAQNECEWHGVSCRNEMIVSGLELCKLD
jgi:hypothetical protein